MAMTARTYMTISSLVVLLLWIIIGASQNASTRELCRTVNLFASDRGCFDSPLGMVCHISTDSRNSICTKPKSTTRIMNKDR